MEQFRTRKGIRRVEHTVGGRTELVDVPVQIREPVQPLDLDAVVAHALAVVTFLVVLGAMAWSTVAIGTLLHRMGMTGEPMVDADVDALVEMVQHVLR